MSVEIDRSRSLINDIFQTAQVKKKNQSYYNPAYEREGKTTFEDLVPDVMTQIVDLVNKGTNAEQKTGTIKVLKLVSKNLRDTLTISNDENNKKITELLKFLTSNDSQFEFRNIHFKKSLFGVTGVKINISSRDATITENDEKIEYEENNMISSVTAKITTYNFMNDTATATATAATKDAFNKKMLYIFKNTPMTFIAIVYKYEGNPVYKSFTKKIDTGASATANVSNIFEEIPSDDVIIRRKPTPDELKNIIENIKETFVTRIQEDFFDDIKSKLDIPEYQEQLSTYFKTDRFVDFAMGSLLSTYANGHTLPPSSFTDMIIKFQIPEQTKVEIIALYQIKGDEIRKAFMDAIEKASNGGGKEIIHGLQKINKMLSFGNKEIQVYKQANKQVVKYKKEIISISEFRKIMNSRRKRIL